MQLQIQMVRTLTILGLKVLEPSPIDMARTHPLPTNVQKTLTKTMKNPKCHLSDGTILHGSIFTNFAIPTEAEKAEIVIVIINIVSF